MVYADIHNNTLATLVYPIVDCGVTITYYTKSHPVHVLFLGENAVIDYRWINNSVVDLYHTEVPPLHRGKGIAQLLAKVNFHTVNSCSTL